MDLLPLTLSLVRRNPYPISIETVLRCQSGVQFMFRITTGSVALSGQPVPSGSNVQALHNIFVLEFANVVGV